MAAAFTQQRQNRCRGFLDRTPRNVNQRPIMFGAQPARGGDLVGDRLLIDIFVIVAMRFEAEKSVLPDLHDALRRGEKTHDQRPLEMFNPGR